MKLKKEIGQQAEVRRLEWWEALTPGEQKFLCYVMRTIRAAKKSQLPEVAHAAAKWEISLACFIKVRLMTTSRTVLKRKLRVVTASPSISQTRSDVSPHQG